MRTPLTIALVLGASLVAAAQGQAPDLGDSASSALESLKGAAEERLLIADMIGHEVKGPDGDTVGTVEDLVAIPGGRLVAAVVSLEDGGRIPVPYPLMKVSSARQSLELTLPSSPDELRSDDAVEEMTSLLGL